VVDTIPGLVWSTRPDGSAEFFNPRWLDSPSRRFYQACFGPRLTETRHGGAPDTTSGVRNTSASGLAKIHTMP
jgi:hypothetical protein